MGRFSHFVFIILLLVLFIAAPWIGDAKHDERGGFHIVECGLKQETTFSDDGLLTPITETTLGKPCTLCDLFPLLKNMLDFIFYYVSIPLAALLLAYGGFLMLIPTFGGEQSVAMYTKGKKVLVRTIAGILIIFFAWLGIDTIIKLVGGKILAQGGFEVQGFFPWNKVTCVATTLGDLSATFSAPVDTATIIDGHNITSEGAQALLTAEGEGIAWDGREGFDVCTLSSLAPYAQIINDVAQQYGISPARIQALIMAESSGRADASHTDRDGGSSHGLTQMRIDTAREIDKSLQGLSDSQVIEKLQSPTYNIALGTRFLADMAKKYGSVQLGNVIFNTGPKGNNPSVNCPGLRAWQCPWDSSGCFGTSNTNCTPNTGYAPTRVYIPRIDSIEAKINAGQC